MITEVDKSISQAEVRAHHIKGKNFVDVFIKINTEKTMKDSHALVANIKSKLKTAPQIDKTKRREPQQLTH